MNMVGQMEQEQAPMMVVAWPEGVAPRIMPGMVLRVSPEALQAMVNQRVVGWWTAWCLVERA